jgi:Skp family chaperone for outer membrane proteins
MKASPYLSIIRQMVLFLLLPISVFGQNTPQVLRADVKVAFVDYAYLRNEYKILNEKLSSQKIEWQDLRTAMKLEKARIDTIKENLRRKQKLDDFEAKYKNRFDDVRQRQEQELKEMLLKIQDAVKSEADRSGYTEIRGTNEGLGGNANNITQQVLKRLNQ